MASTAVEDKRATRHVLASLRTKPSGFVEQVMGIPLYEQQRIILRSVRDHRRTAVRAGNGVGKTFDEACLVLWFLYTHANLGSVRVITTAPTWTQVRDLLWRSISSAHSSSVLPLGGKLTETKLELRNDCFAVGLSTDSPERFAGHHADYLLFVVDEASGVDDAILAAGDGYMTGGKRARVAMFGNPTKTSGAFYRAFHEEAALWNRLKIGAHDTPAFTGEQVDPRVARALPSPEWVDDMLRKYGGENSPSYRVRVLGEFPDQAANAVIALSDLDAAKRRSSSPSGVIRVSCDVARHGDDETVIAVRRGNRVRLAGQYPKQDLMQTTGRILEIARSARAASKGAAVVIVVDDAGLGGGVTDRLKEIGEFPVDPFNGASRPVTGGDYPNRRSEAWFAFSETLHDGDVDLDEDAQLEADLLAPTYKLDSRGRRVVEAKAETKKRLNRSPDRADAVLMAFAPSVGAASERETMYS